MWFSVHNSAYGFAAFVWCCWVQINTLTHSPPTVQHISSAQFCARLSCNDAPYGFASRATQVIRRHRQQHKVPSDRQSPSSTTKDRKEQAWEGCCRQLCFCLFLLFKFFHQLGLLHPTGVKGLRALWPLRQQSNFAIIFAGQARCDRGFVPQEKGLV